MYKLSQKTGYILKLYEKSGQTEKPKLDQNDAPLIYPLCSSCQLRFCLYVNMCQCLKVTEQVIAVLLPFGPRVILVLFLFSQDVSSLFVLAQFQGWVVSTLFWLFMLA